MITVSMATVIDTPRDRVWRALTSPREMLRWDDRVLRFDSDGAGAESATHWRFRLGSVPVDLHTTPIEVIPGRRIRSDVSLGLFRFESTYTLTQHEGEAARTRLALRLAASNVVPVVGGTLDRFDVRRLASGLIGDTLRALQDWCEGPSQSKVAQG